MGDANPPQVHKFSKKELHVKVINLQRICEFLVEQIQPENSDGLEYFCDPEGGLSFKWKKKEEPS